MNPSQFGGAKKTYKRLPLGASKRTTGFFRSKVISEFCVEKKMKQIVIIHYDGIASATFIEDREKGVHESLGFQWATDKLVESDARSHLLNYVAALS
jgi:hypothetical protein